MSRTDDPSPERTDYDLPPGVREKLPGTAIIVEHEPVGFPNYPYEWAPAMLHAAGILTLRMAQEATGAGFGLKDATPYNVTFDAAKPVFIDLLSFERRDPLDPLWRPYAQFVRTFLYPLLANRYFGLRLDELLLLNRDGLESRRMFQLCSPWRLLFPPFWNVVTWPMILSIGDGHAGADRYRMRQARDRPEAKFLLDRVFARARRLLDRASCPARPNSTTQYMECHTYSTTELAEKERAVSAALQRHPPGSVLDIGCNTGHFSMLACRHGARVVAIDRDPDSVGVLWALATKAGLNILPLVIDIARPPGASGWANSECPSFLDRARGKFNCVLMLALVHHLLANERVPLDRIFQLIAELTTQLAVIEYVDPADPQFRRIVRGREALHVDFTRQSFEEAATHRFQVIECRDVTATRCIYTLGKRS